MNNTLSDGKSVREYLYDIITIFQFDLVELLSVDFIHTEIQVQEAVSKTPVAVLEFEFNSIKDILLRLKSERTGFYINSSNPHQRVNTQFKSEVFIPYFGMDFSVAGFIYCAKYTELSSDILNDAALTKVLRLLIPLIEQQHVAEQLQAKLHDTILLFSEVINAREPHNIVRNMSVFYWAKRIADELKLSHSDIHKMHVAVMMHDMGKIYISDKLLNKEKLTLDESQIMKTYITHSYEIADRLGRIFELDDIPKIIRSSHERVDGKGYPDGLSGTEIPLISRIIYVAKAISEMLTNTQYRKAKPTESIVREIMEQADERFDGELAKIAVKVLLSKDSDYMELFEGLGNYVTLSIGLYQEEPRNIWGSVRKTNEYFEFYPSAPLPVISFNQITSIFLYTNINEAIQKYKLDVKKIYKDKLVFTNLAPLNNEKAFSIQWALSGIFITEHKKQYPINVISLGGDCIDFYINKDEQAETFNSGIIALRTDNENLLSIPGVITFSQGIFNKIYYRFEYTNISDSTQKNLFSALFRKQLEFRKMSHLSQTNKLPLRMNQN